MREDKKIWKKNICKLNRREYVGKEKERSDAWKSFLKREHFKVELSKKWNLSNQIKNLHATQLQNKIK